MDEYGVFNFKNLYDMSKLYLFIYSDSLGNREEVKVILNDISEVLSWRYDMPYSFYILSDASANQLVDLIHSKVAEGKSVRFFITEILNSNRQGYLPKATWDFLGQER